MLTSRDFSLRLDHVELTHFADLRLANANINIGVEFLKIENASKFRHLDCDAAMPSFRFDSMCLTIAADKQQK